MSDIIHLQIPDDWRRVSYCGEVPTLITEAGDNRPVCQVCYRGIMKHKATNLPTPELVEAAARAMHAARYPRFEWDGEDKAVKGLYRDRARVALSAALPLLPDVGDLLVELDRLRAATVKLDRDTIVRALCPGLADLGLDPSQVVDATVNIQDATDAVLAVLPGRTEAQVKAEAWNEGFEAGATWSPSGPSGVPHDPPVNPYERGEQ